MNTGVAYRQTPKPFGYTLAGFFQTRTTKKICKFIHLCSSSPLQAMRSNEAMRRPTCNSVNMYKPTSLVLTYISKNLLEMPALNICLLRIALDDHQGFPPAAATWREEPEPPRGRSPCGGEGNPCCHQGPRDETGSCAGRWMNAHLVEPWPPVQLLIFLSFGKLSLIRLAEYIAS